MGGCSPVHPLDQGTLFTGGFCISILLGQILCAYDVGSVPTKQQDERGFYYSTLIGSSDMRCFSLFALFCFFIAVQYAQ